VNIKLASDRRPILAAATFELGPVLPLLNEKPMPEWQLAEVPARATGERCWRYTAPVLGAGSVHLVAVVPVDGDSGGWLQYWLEDTPPNLVIDSLGIRFEHISGARAILRQGYHSWDGGEFVATGVLAGSATAAGYALTQLLPAASADNLVLGFDRHDRFQHTFTYRRAGDHLALDVLTLWDRKEADRAGVALCERLLLLAQPGVEAGLRRWASRVAAGNPDPPRRLAQPVSGWCSWYNHYASIDEATIRVELHGAATVRDEHGLRLDVFQIDDGFTPEMGDWLEVKPQFPNGMGALLAEIRAAGFRPGLWIAPFMVGNRSRLYQAHPDWVVRDRSTGGPLVQLRFYGEFRWHKRSEEYYILDGTHPEAFAYLRHVFATWAREWGCDYFKTDFMYFGCEYGPDRALYHTPGLTRVEIWRRVAAMIREEIGEALWLGCGCPLWPAIGLVDAVRIGGDMGVRWAGEQSAQSVLGDLQVRNFANGILWQLDPDCLLLRDRYHDFSDGELRALALYAGLAGGVLITSDTLAELPPDRLDLLRFLLELPPGDCRFPRLGEENEDGVIIQLRSLGATGASLLFAFNRGEQPVRHRIDVAAMGIAVPVHVAGWPERGGATGAVMELELVLPAHDGRLLTLTPAG
jgi:alpha-galactosidase